MNHIGGTMKVLCDGQNLYNAVMKVSKAISSKTTNPILEGIKITAKEDSLIIVATDLEISIKQKINADVLIEGETVVPGKYFTDFIKKLSGEQIKLFLESQDKIVIEYGENEMSFQCMNAEQFPKVDEIKKVDSFTINQGDFKDMINKTSFCVSKEDSRPVLKGCLIETVDSEIKCVALDGYRLAFSKKKLEERSKKLSIIVPQRTLNEISKLIEKDENIMTVFVDKNKLMVEIDGTIFISKLIEGEFVKYENIIPTTFETIVTIDKKEMDNTLERASILTRGININIVSLDIKSSSMTILSKSEIGKIKEKINIVKDGEDMKINFNPKYLTDVTKTLEDEFIKIKMNNKTKPAIISAVEGDDYLYMILPVRTID